MTLTRIILKVVARVNGNRRPNACHNQRKEEREAIEPKAQLQPQFRHPRVRFSKHVARRHGGRLQQQPAKNQGRRKRGKPSAVAETMGLQRRHQGPNQGDEHQAQGKHGHAGMCSFLRSGCEEWCAALRPTNGL